MVAGCTAFPLPSHLFPPHFLPWPPPPRTARVESIKFSLRVPRALGFVEILSGAAVVVVPPPLHLLAPSTPEVERWAYSPNTEGKRRIAIMEENKSLFRNSLFPFYVLEAVHRYAWASARCSPRGPPWAEAWAGSAHTRAGNTQRPLTRPTSQTQKGLPRTNTIVSW